MTLASPEDRCRAVAGPEGCTDRAKPVRLVTRYGGAVDVQRAADLYAHGRHRSD
jgi:hypothetical protein